MEANQILNAEVLDIIFDARNKKYGAYDLRKNYQRRLLKAMATTSLVVVLLLITYLLVAAIKPKAEGEVIADIINLENVKDKKIEEHPVVIPPPMKQQPVEIKTKMFTQFLITPDDKVREEEKPAEQKELDDVKIGTANVDGKADDGIVKPPVDEGKGLVEAPKQMDNAETIFTKVEIESEYAGGKSAWVSYLNHNLVYPQEAIDINVEGTVYIQFIVDTEGNVSDVTAISGPAALYSAAVKVIKKSGKWIPAVQNGRQVKSYKRQPITFKLNAD